MTMERWIPIQKGLDALDIERLTKIDSLIGEVNLGSCEDNLLVPVVGHVMGRLADIALKNVKTGYRYSPKELGTLFWRAASRNVLINTVKIELEKSPDQRLTTFLDTIGKIIIF